MTTRSWTIGKGADCDLVVDRPTVSEHHCRLSSDASGFLLEDLGSTNGTYVNGARLTAKVRVTRGDAITLGLTIPLPWPSEVSPAGSRFLRIGRESDNDFVVAFPSVSGHHARVVWQGTPGEAQIEDLGSSNGTGLGSPDRKVTRASFTASDTIYLGSYPVPGAQLLARVEPAPVLPSGSETWSVELPKEFARTLDHPWRLAVLFLQAPLFALAIVVALRANHAALLSWLGLAAIWFGLSNAVLGEALEPSRSRGGKGPGGLARLIARAVVLGTLCLVQCVLAWVVVSQGAGLKSPGMPALGLLMLASAVGLTLGLNLVSLTSRPAPALAFLPMAMLALWLLGGEPYPVPRLPSMARVASNALPSRWAFEGMLLLEGDRSPTGVADPASDFFPADSERMGVRADAIALTAMLIGLAASAGFIAAAPAPKPGV